MNDLFPILIGSGFRSGSRAEANHGGRGGRRVAGRLAASLPVRRKPGTADGLPIASLCLTLSKDRNSPEAFGYNAASTLNVHP